MQNKFRGVNYDYGLLRRTISSLECEERAQDPIGMNELMEDGIKIRNNGGIFVFDVDAYHRLHTVCRQTTRNKQFLDMFGNYIAMDGTHLVDKYGHVMVLLNVTDSLGLTQVVGTIVCPSEDGLVMEGGMQKFGVTKGQDKVLHTDGGSWGPLLAANYDRRHHLCASHFSTKVRQLSTLVQ